MRQLQGMGVCSGIAIGRAYCYVPQSYTISREQLPPGAEAAETDRLQQAFRLAKDELNTLQLAAQKAGRKDQADLLFAHSIFLEDATWQAEILQTIQEKHLPAEAAVQDTAEAYIESFEAMDDPYFSQRSADIADVAQRLLAVLTGNSRQGLPEIPSGSILIAEDLAPSDTAQFDPSVIGGFAICRGSQTSHTAILARSLGIPAIVGVPQINHLIHHGEALIIDGDAGCILIDPDPDTLSYYQEKKAALLDQAQRLKEKLDGIPAQTADHARTVELSANIGRPEEADAVLQSGADGIGLFRTEFLFMDQDQLPDEETQFQAYFSVAQKLYPRHVTIRTLDIGGDKNLEYLNLDKEENPFLGFRAIRMCLARKDLFKTQLRAILRAAVLGNIKIMYPMISAVHEIDEANAILQEAAAELSAQGVEYGKDVPVGMMMEVPSAAITADLFAKKADFFSIGSNDLTQYTTASDRMNPNVAHLCTVKNPAVLRLIQNIIRAGHSANIPVGMCGEMASDPEFTEILLGMGLDEFSMNSNSILKIKDKICSTTLDSAQIIAKNSLEYNP